LFLLCEKLIAGYTTETVAAKKNLNLAFLSPTMRQSYQIDPMPYLFFLFLFMPVIEIWLIIEVGSSIGAVWTILLIFFTAFLGATLLRQQGFSTLFRARE